MMGWRIDAGIDDGATTGKQLVHWLAQMLAQLLAVPQGGDSGWQRLKVVTLAGSDSGW